MYLILNSKVVKRIINLNIISVIETSQEWSDNDTISRYTIEIKFPFHAENVNFFTEKLRFEHKKRRDEVMNTIIKAITNGESVLQINYDK
jgi:hypothetical protein